MSDDMDDNMNAPVVTGSPDIIWLQYGDIERDCTHAECSRDGDVTWCEDAQFDSDVKYVRADIFKAAIDDRDRLRAENARLRDVLKRGAAIESQFSQQGYETFIAEIESAARKEDKKLRAMLSASQSATGGAT